MSESGEPEGGLHPSRIPSTGRNLTADLGTTVYWPHLGPGKAWFMAAIVAVRAPGRLRRQQRRQEQMGHELGMVLDSIASIGNIYKSVSSFEYQTVDACGV